MGSRGDNIDIDVIYNMIDNNVIDSNMIDNYMIVNSLINYIPINLILQTPKKMPGQTTLQFPSRI
jgi:hypothetical protein